MAVKQDAGAGGAGGGAAIRLSDDNRMAIGRPNAGFKADRGQIGGDMLGRGAALVLVGRIGRYRGNTEQRKQPLDALVDILVDAFQYRVKRTHALVPSKIERHASNARAA